MKCSKCGAPIRSGHLYCDKCGHEVQLVPDYNPLGNMMSNQRKKEEKRKKILEAERRRKEKIAKKRKKALIVTCIFIVVCIIIVIARKYYKENQNYNSFDFQMQKATSSYEKSDYDSAMQYVDRALTIDSQDVEANLLMAKVQEGTGNISAAISIINSVIKANPDSEKAYEQILTLYESRQMTTEIKTLMDACTSDVIRQTFSDYIVQDPEVNISSGTYDYKPEIIISASDDCQIYYTLDGTIPTTQSEPYEESFTLGRGTTHLKVICVNPKGILSNVISCDYRVILK